MKIRRAKTNNGWILGVEGEDMLVFKGIPYAAAPVGSLRWQPPQDVEPWATDRDATGFGPSAMQGSLGEMGEMIGVASGPISEDCLTLNIFTSSLFDELRPVMVWIHGGGNVVGSSAQPRFNGEHLARRARVVVVTINYRLGAFGFLHAPELGATGNEALLDQIAALRWVRREIRRFGGNPDNVTVFGQSAGAFDIVQLMGMEAAEGCFDRIALMSGSLTPQVLSDEAHATAARFAEAFGGFEALRDVPAQQILDHQLALTGGGLAGAVRFGPVRDGVLIREDAAVPIGTGRFTQGIPLMLGTTRDEWGLWTAMNPVLQQLDEAGLEKLARRLFGKHVRAGIEVYRDSRGRAGEEISPVALWRAMMTDSMFRIPATRTAQLHAQHTETTWMYRFDYPSPALEGRLGACHSLDVPFVFGTVGVGELQRLCGTSRLVPFLSEVLVDTYCTLARRGDPSNANLLSWPSYEPAQRATMVLSMESHLEEAPEEDLRQFWEALQF